MRFEFDAAKDAANIVKHGVSLERAEEFVPEVVEEDRRFDYAEVRYRAFGLLDELPHCLAFTIRGPVIRAVSFRRMHLKGVSPPCLVTRSRPDLPACPTQT